MHPVDVEEALQSMVVLVDTREQQTATLQQRCKAFGQWERMKLEAGDYSAKFRLPDGVWYFLPASVERKFGIDELCMCYCRERKRFEREFLRAQDAGIKLYLLVEDATWKKVYGGKYHSQMRPQSLTASIFAWLARYNCQIIFCEKELSGQMIRDILYREGKESLLKHE